MEITVVDLKKEQQVRHEDVRELTDAEVECIGGAGGGHVTLSPIFNPDGGGHVNG